MLTILANLEGELAALREENARLKAQISGSTLVPELVELQRENARLRQKTNEIADRLGAALRERDEARAEVKCLHSHVEKLARERAEQAEEIAFQLRRADIAEAKLARCVEAGQRCMEISTSLAAAGIVGHQNILDVMGAALAAARSGSEPEDPQCQGDG